MSEPGRLPIGQGARVGGYVLDGLLGQGGMGQVWRARDEALGRVVALKVVPISFRDDRRARALRELEAASRVKHPNIVDVHAAGEAPGCLFLVMDLVEGQTLDRLLAGGPLPPRRAVELTLGLARALAALHAAGVLHRDVKPGNVLLGPDGAPRLMDFGVARLRDADRLTRTDQMLGTPIYMAPEQMAGEPVDERADVYAAGAVLYEALTGRPPAEGETLMALAAAKESAPRPPSGHGAEVDPALDAVTLTALAPVAERYPTAQALADELERWLAGEPVQALPRRSTARRVLLGLVPLLLLVVLVAAWIARRSPGGAESLAPTLARARQSFEELAARTPDLAALDVEPARALVARARAAGAPAADLERWVALVELARANPPAPAEAPAGVPAASERGVAPQALRGALLRAAEPAAALAALEQARRGGLDAVELRRWRLEALAAIGVGTRDEAAARLAELDALAALDPSAAARLEVACLVALGRPREARLALARAGHAPDLAWAVGVAEARELVAAGDLAAAWQVLAPTPRPPGQARPAESDLAKVALEAALTLVRERARATSPLRGRAEVELVVAGFALHVRALPAPVPPLEDLEPIGQVVLQTCVLQQGASSLPLAEADLFPDHRGVQATVALWFATSSEEGPLVSQRIVELARRNLARAAPEDVPVHALSLARQLLAHGQLDEGGAALDRIDPDAAPGDVRELVTELTLILRCMLLRARGEFRAALALLDEGDRRGLKEFTNEERRAHRLATLRAAGRKEEALALVLRFMAGRPATSGHVRVALSNAAWALCLEAGRLEELRAFAGSFARELDSDGLWFVRQGWVEATLGDLERGAATLERARALLRDPDLPGRVRAGDAEALARVREVADDGQVKDDRWRWTLECGKALR